MINRIKILVVEDTPIAARMARMALERRGCTVDCVETGEAALAKQEANYQLVLMDLGLPGLDGYETARRLRLNKQHQPIAAAPIIALTAHGDDNEKVSLARQAGMNGFIAKPLTPEACDLLLGWFDANPMQTNEDEHFFQPMAMLASDLDPH